MNTRFFYDEVRVQKQLQQSTDPGRWVLDVPGNGSSPCYISDPQIRIQGWGANLRTHPIELENELKGLGRCNYHDCRGKDEYTRYQTFNSIPITYPECETLTTEESRAICPAWMFREKQQEQWYMTSSVQDETRGNQPESLLVFNPQQNCCIPFQNNIQTRILEKDFFTPRIIKTT